MSAQESVDSTVSSVGSYMHDAEPSVRLRQDGQSPITTTTLEDGIEFSFKAGGYAQANITVEASDDGDGDETYVLNLYASQDDSNTDPLLVGSAVVPRGYSGSFPITFYGPSAVRLYEAAYPAKSYPEENPCFIAIEAQLGGTTPALTYSAQIGPVPANY